MNAVNAIKALIPGYAKDVRLNLDSTIARSTLRPAEALGVALAAAYASKNARLVAKESGMSVDQLRDAGRIAAVVAAAANVLEIESEAALAA
ncbi:MAG TPA: hypothetical protein VLW55_25675 [Burkholderiaceae bacterium]|nr:hypothetical protein [Burkholderiaceae bacterium]